MLLQAAVFAGQILLLVLTWHLFQQARSELNARAVETPVLGEIKALHRSIKQLLEEMEATSAQTSARLESQCREAQELLESLERRQDAFPQIVEESPAPPPAKRRAAPRRATTASVATLEPLAEAAVTTAQGPRTSPKTEASQEREARRRAIYDMADAGEASPAIARTTGLSEGEVETLLGLRVQRSKNK